MAATAYGQILVQAVVLCGIITMASAQAQPADAADDPYLWLEQQQGAAALAWVKTRNDASLRALEAMPRFDDYRLRAEAALTEKQRIAWPRLVEDDLAANNSGILGQSVVNFWQDDRHVRGIWRETPLDAYLAGTPRWRTLIDLDAVSASEKRGWVWKGAHCLAPAYRRCMVRLSDGGKDAVVLREFDRETGGFVAGGFQTPEAKVTVAWSDADHLLIGTGMNDASLTASGYARQVRLWKRGTPLSGAPVLFNAEADDVSAVAQSDLSGPKPLRMVYHAKTFRTGTLHHLDAANRLHAGPLPADADVLATLNGRVIALLRSPWRRSGQVLPAGALVAYAVSPVLEGQAAPIELVYTPPPGVAVQQVLAGPTSLYISVLDKVSGRVVEARRLAKGWNRRVLLLPANSTLTPLAATPTQLLVKAESFLDPARLLAAGPRGFRTVAATPARFDAQRFTVSQRFARASDGVMVPFFIVQGKPQASAGVAAKPTPGPTLIFAYGGFEIAKLPEYVSPDIQFWLEEGGTYVLANLRGGGEFGPAWHQAGLREKRQRVFDDLYAVAETLVRTGVTTPPQLGIHGRSNGGLLASVAMTQRPRMFGAAMIGVPLTDMKRYNKLLAGASWMAEYGNPDVPADWAFISRYSPFHAVRAGEPYPVPFIYTSTKDDRVHPAHARKFAARLDAKGYPYFYYENMEGGHAGVASLKEAAYRMALMLTYLNRELRGIGRDSLSPPRFDPAGADVAAKALR